VAGRGGVRLTVAFASPRHARDAVRFLAGSTLHVTAFARPAADDSEMALVDLEIPGVERVRLDTLISGVHGIVIDQVAIPSELIA
jgi:hypothetical protein